MMASNIDLNGSPLRHCFAQECLGSLSRLLKFTACELVYPVSLINEERFTVVTAATSEFACATEGGARFLSSKPFRPHDSLCIVGLHLRALSCIRGDLHPDRAVRHRYRRTEMRNRLLKGASAERGVAGLAPPFD